MCLTNIRQCPFKANYRDLNFRNKLVTAVETLNTVPAMYSTHVHDPNCIWQKGHADGIVTIGIGCSFNCSGYDV